MKWIIAVVIALTLFVLIIGGMFLFSTAIAEKAEVWQQSAVLLSYPLRLALSVSNYFRANWVLISPAILLLCLVGSLTIAALIRKK